MMKGLTSLMKDLNRNLFFDLDGTILNSEISIRTSLEHSIKKNCPEYLDKINFDIFKIPFPYMKLIIEKKKK